MHLLRLLVAGHKQLWSLAISNPCIQCHKWPVKKISTNWFLEQAKERGGLDVKIQHGEGSGTGQQQSCKGQSQLAVAHNSPSAHGKLLLAWPRRILHAWVPDCRIVVSTLVRKMSPRCKPVGRCFEKMWYVWKE